MTRLYLILLAASFFVLQNLTQAAKPGVTKYKCDAADKQNVDELVARIMTFGRTDRTFPESKKELKLYCK